MSDAREIIRLKFLSVSTHEIARRLWHGALDGAGDVEADGGRGAILALAGEHERRRAGGGGALRQPTRITRSIRPSVAGKSPPRG